MDFKIVFASLTVALLLLSGCSQSPAGGTTGTPTPAANPTTPTPAETPAATPTQMPAPQQPGERPGTTETPAVEATPTPEQTAEPAPATAYSVEDCTYLNAADVMSACGGNYVFEKASPLSGTEKCRAYIKDAVTGMQKAIVLTAEEGQAAYFKEGCDAMQGTLVGETGCVHTNGRYAYVLKGSVQANFWNGSADSLACNEEQMHSLVELIQSR
ncbi:MAG: hypothetical protein NT067_04390 [Candidatus Diapherotrites archaeon]|nr:hypothetical protein [Candidatus Diapherotrites archaeon]